MYDCERSVQDTADKDGSGVSLSVVVPVYNEEAVLSEFHRRLSVVLWSMHLTSEIIFVNDGSTDGSLPNMHRLRSQNPTICVVDLSRNYGKEIALSAGLDHAKGDAVVVIDADLQDPPELIPELVKCWREGYDVVYAKRVVREGESAMKKITACAFYRLMRCLSKIKIPENTGDFRLLSRRAVDSLRLFREHHRFMKGLFTWIGYPQKEITYRRDPRFAGQTKWNYWRLWNFALEGITSFTIAPLKFATYLGLLAAVVAFIFGIFIIYRTIIYGDPVKGYPSLMVVMLFLGSIQLIALGVIGEYVGRIFTETKQRPLYFVKTLLPSSAWYEQERESSLPEPVERNGWESKVTRVMQE